ncbi:MAG: serine protease, partial [Candidatus Electrothrix sp. ATG2]|nr:serine protease [Candidatus Electrothrix sp. ATG2]
KRSIVSAEQPPLAIVSVTTSWGRGVGFFIRENALITSKHLVEPDVEKLAALQEQVTRNRKLLDLEEDKLRSYQARLKKVNRGSSKDELNLLIMQRKKHLADFRFQQEKEEQRLAEQKKAQEYSVMTIMLADGSEQNASLVQVSKDYNLALLTTLSARKSPVLQSPPLGSLLRLGDTVFLPGGLVGTEERLITGTFAGYRRVGVQNRMFLQIAADISLDKIGGPVLDVNGHVRGVMTRTGRDGKKAGFAVPIERVVDEFAEVLQEQDVTLSATRGGDVTENIFNGRQDNGSNFRHFGYRGYCGDLCYRPGRDSCQALQEIHQGNRFCPHRFWRGKGDPQWRRFGDAHFSGHDSGEHEHLAPGSAAASHRGPDHQGSDAGGCGC